jgi:transcription elongation factor Elf1
MEFTKELKEKIIKELDERIEKLNKNFQCPICNHKNFNVVEGFTRKDIDDDFSKIIIGRGKIIPSMSIICNNCGFMADFAIGALGFLEDKEKTEEKKDGKKRN